MAPLKFGTHSADDSDKTDADSTMNEANIDSATGKPLVEGEGVKEPENLRQENEDKPPEDREVMGQDKVDSNIGAKGTQHASQDKILPGNQDQTGQRKQQTLASEHPELVHRPTELEIRKQAQLDSASDMGNSDPEDEKDFQLYSSHPADNLHFTDEFKFKDGRLRLHKSKVEDFEQLLKAQPINIKIMVKKIDKLAADALVRSRLGRMVSGIDTTANTLAPSPNQLA